MQRMRKLVGHYRLVQLGNHTQLDANQCPTRLAILRQLG